MDGFVEWYQRGRDIVEAEGVKEVEGVVLTDGLRAMAGKLADQSASEAVLIHALGAQLATTKGMEFLKDCFDIVDCGGYETVETNWLLHHKYVKSVSVEMAFLKRWTEMKTRQVVMNLVNEVQRFNEEKEELEGNQELSPGIKERMQGLDGIPPVQDPLLQGIRILITTDEFCKVTMKKLASSLKGYKSDTKKANRKAMQIVLLASQYYKLENLYFAL